MYLKCLSLLRMRLLRHHPLRTHLLDLLLLHTHLLCHQPLRMHLLSHHSLRVHLLRLLLLYQQHPPY
jgi:hypothetical protein